MEAALHGCADRHVFILNLLADGDALEISLPRLLRYIREVEIKEVMLRTNFLYPEAAALVARRYGEDVSDVFGPDGPLTDEQRQRLGLGESLADVAESASGIRTAAPRTPKP